MYCYTSFDLTIRSELRLPELIPVEAASGDIMIRCGMTGSPRPKPGPDGSAFSCESDEAYFFWQQVGAFLVRRGQEIIVEPRSNVEERLIRLPLLGNVLSAALLQRQHLCLHASGVQLNGGATAFMGRSGQGKSTIAAAFYSRGHTFIGDDLIAVDFSRKRPYVTPGFPWIKIMPHVASDLFPDGRIKLTRLAHQVPKVGCSTKDNAMVAPLPLNAIFLLEEDATITVERLEAGDAIWHLIRQSYPLILHKDHLPAAIAAENLVRCSWLAKEVPTYRLRRPRTMEALPDVMNVVEETIINTVAAPQLPPISDQRD